MAIDFHDGILLFEDSCVDLRFFGPKNSESLVSTSHLPKKRRWGICPTVFPSSPSISIQKDHPEISLDQTLHLIMGVSRGFPLPNFAPYPQEIRALYLSGINLPPPSSPKSLTKGPGKSLGGENVA